MPTSTRCRNDVEDKANRTIKASTKEIQNLLDNADVESIDEYFSNHKLLRKYRAKRKYMNSEKYKEKMRQEKKQEQEKCRKKEKCAQHVISEIKIPSMYSSTSTHAFDLSDIEKSIKLLLRFVILLICFTISILIQMEFHNPIWSIMPLIICLIPMFPHQAETFGRVYIYGLFVQASLVSLDLVSIVLRFVLIIILLVEGVAIEFKSSISDVIQRVEYSVHELDATRSKTTQ